MPKGPGRGGAREGSGRKKKLNEPTSPIRVPESIAERVRKNLEAGGFSIYDAVSEPKPMTLDEFDALPRFEWDVQVAWPSPDGRGITMTQGLTLQHEAVDKFRAQIRKMVETGDLLPGEIQKETPFATKVFFGHPGWTGGMIGYKIDLAPDRFNFSSLRRVLETELVDPEGVGDFINTLIIHQMDKRSITMGIDGSKIQVHLTATGEVPSVFGGGKEPAYTEYNFKTNLAAEEVLETAQTIIEKSSNFMDEVWDRHGGRPSDRIKRLKEESDEQ